MGIQWPHHCGVIRIQDKKDKNSSSRAFKIAIISITLFSFTRWLLNTLWRKKIGRGSHTYYKLLLPKSLFSCFEHIITVGCTTMYFVHWYCSYETWAIPCSFTYNHILCNSNLSTQIPLPFHVFIECSDFLSFLIYIMECKLHILRLRSIFYYSIFIIRKKFDFSSRNCKQQTPIFWIFYILFIHAFKSYLVKSSFEECSLPWNFEKRRK